MRVQTASSKGERKEKEKQQVHLVVMHRPVAKEPKTSMLLSGHRERVHCRTLSTTHWRSAHSMGEGVIK